MVCDGGCRLHRHRFAQYFLLMRIVVTRIDRGVMAKDYVMNGEMSKVSDGMLCGLSCTVVYCLVHGHYTS